jgi:uncharacterized protein YqgC (DUF456 family)
VWNTQDELLSRESLYEWAHSRTLNSFLLRISVATWSLICTFVLARTWGVEFAGIYYFALTAGIVGSIIGPAVGGTEKS